MPGLNPRNLTNYPVMPYKYQAVISVGIVVVGVTAGYYFERQEFNRMTRFRDKSALFGKQLGPDDPPSWGDKEYAWRVSSPEWEKKHNKWLPFW